MQTEGAKERVGNVYDKLADSYDSVHVQPKDRAEDNLHARLLSSTLKKKHWGGKLLDVGCGTGLALRLAQVKEQDYLGIDPSGGMLDRARARHPTHEFLQCGVYDLASFDHRPFGAAISFFGSLNYPDSLYYALELIYNHLLPEAPVAFSIYTPRNHLRKTYVLRDCPEEVQGRGYRAKDVVSMMMNIGYKGIRARGMSAFVDHLPRSLPQPVFNGYLRAEHATVGVVAPGACYYTILTAHA
jgi:SAM-dependent methyltransferase